MASELKAAKPETILSLQQQEALAQLKIWWESKELYRVILGKPGTGKTFLTRYFAAENKNLVPLFTAPTNEAARQLEMALQGTAPTKTTYSALGLKMSNWSETREIYQGVLPEDLGDYNLLVVDEASMVGSSAKDDDPKRLLDYAMDLGMRILWLGDDCQLPPVEAKDGLSPVFQQEWPTIYLDQVMRHSGPILELADLIRAQIKSPLRNFPKVPEGIESVPNRQIVDRLLQAETFEKLMSGDCRIISWTNAVVDIYNLAVRSHMFGPEKAKAGFLYPEDQILFTQPLFTRRNIERMELRRLLDEENEPELTCSINTKAKVVKTEPTEVFGIPVLRVHLLVEGGMNTVGYFPTREGEKMKEAVAKGLKNTAQTATRNKGQAWKWFHSFNECFMSCKHSYAITGHRSQGSTISEVFVDVGNMLANPNRLEAFKNLYVGATRAKDRLYLIRG